MIRNNTLICLRALSVHFVNVIVVFVATASLAQAQNASQGSGVTTQKLQQTQQRVEQLENRLTDMQVVVSTLESLVRNELAKAPQVTRRTAQSNASDDQSSFADNNPFRSDGQQTQTVIVKSNEPDERIDGMETQIRALSSQVAQVTNQVQSMARQLGAMTKQMEELTTQNLTRNSFRNPQSSPIAEFSQDRERDQGLTTFSTDTTKPRDITRRSQDANITVAALPKPKNEVSPEQLYDEAYGHMLRRDYESAELAFRNFLKSHSKDKLAGNAQYWLGETYFVRGSYRKAADHFLKSYTKFSKGQKAPDSLLKLALSLGKLGRKQAACTTFVELKQKFPKAPSHVEQRAVSERKNLGCS